jgi:hypothetical protein
MPNQIWFLRTKKNIIAKRNGSLVVALIMLVMATTISVLVVPKAKAACPQGSPCSDLDVFRYQSWPMPLLDASGNNLLTLQSANAGDGRAILGLIKARVPGEHDIVVKSTATVINNQFSTYCNCNLQLNNAGCPPNSTSEKLLQCSRSCLNDLKQCAGFGNNVIDVGVWYAFPRSTMYTDGAVWRKNVFERKPSYRDWLETSTIYKRAGCLKQLAISAEHFNSSFSQIFELADCVEIDYQDLVETAIPRPDL